MYMNNNTIYIPFKGETYAWVKGEGLTKKGKKSLSYIFVNGQRFPVWIKNHGGYDKVISEIKNYVNNNYDRFPISRLFNVSPITMKRFIMNNLPKDYIDQELKNFKTNSTRRKSLNSKGRISPHKGKTYKEIHGTDTPGCGFKKGMKNPNFTRDKYIGCKLLNKYGQKFRSSYEVRFSELLTDNQIPYDYEHGFRMLNGKVKIVDFIVNEKLVEVTGYAYEKWKNDFDVKIYLLHKSYPDKQIVIIAETDKIEELKTKHGLYTTVLDINHHSEIISVL